MKEHTFSGTLLQLKPHLISADDMKIFSLVSAKLDPSRFTVDVKELRNLLIKTQKKTGVNFMETCEGFVVAGTLEQIDKSCLFLSKYAKPPDRKRESPDDLENGQDNGDPLSDSDDEGKSLEMLVLDVEPKLMRLLQKQLDIIEKKYKMKIDWEGKSGKAHLSPIGKDVSRFDQGKEEFITLYQKEFQDLQERELLLDAVKNIADLEKTTKELTQNFAVIIEKKDDKVLHIFGKEEDVSQVMKRLQAKFGKRRGRKAYIEANTGELPKPDTYAQAAMLPLSQTLDNGVVVSVHQGDITKVQVDVIVNAANENLSHGGGVAGAIVKQGGRQIQTESDALVYRYGCVPVGQVVHTGPGRLPCKRIFHAVGPQWKFHGEQASRQFIFDACMNSFNLASKHRMSSIALPGISSGIYGVPKEICAETMFAAAEIFSAEPPSANQLKHIRFVNIDSPTYEAFQREFCSRYGLLKEKEANLASNLYHENAVHSSFKTDKEREYQKITYQENLGSTQGANNIDSEHEIERQKRADAANRRIEQGKREETAKDGEQPRKHEALSKNSPNENKPNFFDGFNKRGNRSRESKKFEGRKNAINSHAPNGNERDSTEGTVEFGHGREEKDKEEKRDKINKEKFKKGDDGKETKKGEEKVMEDNEPKLLPKHDNQNQVAERLIYEFGNLEIKEKKKESVKAEGNDNSMKRIIESGDRGGKKQPDFHDAPDKSLNDSKDVTEKIEKGNRLYKGFSEESSVGRNNSEHTNHLENKSFRSAGRGRGARTLAPAFQDTPHPGHAARQNQSNIHAENPNEGNESSGGGRKVPPGLTITQDGLDFAKKATREGDEADKFKLIEAEGILNVRKKHLEKESKDITDGVPAKKAKEDEDAREKKGQKLRKAGENKAKDIKGGELIPDKTENSNDIKEIRKEVTEKVEDDHLSDNETKEIPGIHDEKKEEGSAASTEATEHERPINPNVEIEDQKSGCDLKQVSSAYSCESILHKKPMNRDDEQSEDGKGSEEKTKDNSTTISAEGTDPKKSMNSNYERGDDGDDSGQDSKEDSNIISAERTDPKKSLDSNYERGDDGDDSGQDSKEDSTTISAKGTDPKKSMNSNYERGDDGDDSGQDSKEDSTTISAEGTDPKKSMNSNYERGDDGDDSAGQDSKEDSTTISAEGTDPKKSMNSNYERGDDGDDSGQDSKEDSNIISAEGTDPKKSLDPHNERLGDGQGSNAKEKSAVAISAEGNEPNEPDSEDGRSSGQDEIKPTKPMDSKDDLVKENQISGQNAKEDKTLHSEIIDSSDKPDYDRPISNQDLNGKSSRDTPDSDDFSNFSAEPDSMASFVLVSIPPNNDQINHPRDARTSGSSDESSKSIVGINHPEGDELSGPSSSPSPVNEQEGNDAHPPGQDINRSKVGSSEEKEEKDKLPVSLVAEKKVTDEKEEYAAARSGDVGEIANPDEERASHSPSAKDISRDKDAAVSLKKTDSSSGNSSLPAPTKDQECGLCYVELDLAQAVKICDHLLCQNCVKSLKKSELSNTCKICHRSVQIALQPLNGQMKSGVIKGSLPGYEGCETLYIDYEFPEGIQGLFHPNPGTPYDELSRRIFLPNNEGGMEVLELLRKAFDAEVLFTVGKSTISGKVNQIIFNTDIDHKTNIKGGPTVSGYPDPGYLSRVKEQLKTKGIE